MSATRRVSSHPLLLVFAVALGLLMAVVAPAQTNIDAALDTACTHLYVGETAAAEESLTTALESIGDDDSLLHLLAHVRLLRMIEGNCQDLYEMEPSRLVAMGLMMQLGPEWRELPEAGEVKPFSYVDLRKIFAANIADLKRVDETLAKIGDSDAKFAIRIGLIRLDLNGDGQADDSEAFWQIYRNLNREARELTLDQASEFVIAFDRADVEWLRGYCNLLLAFHEFLLAWDMQPFFDRVGHAFFGRVESQYAFQSEPGSGFDWPDALDMVAAVHLIDFECTEPERLKRAHAHLKQMLVHSRKMWRFATAETDNDAEWIPAPGQDGVLPGVEVTPVMLQGWEMFCDEAEALLDGRKLAPFWRTRGTPEGVNIRRAFYEPRNFDLVLWIQGSAAVPYLEEGTMTEKETWNRLNEMFRGNFVGFAVWIN